MALLVVAMALLVVATAGAQAPTHSAESSQWSVATILITSVVGFCSLLATNIFQMVRESRNRKWDEQERARAREEVAVRARNQRIDTIQSAIELAKMQKAAALELAKLQRETNDIVMAELSKNTEITAEAGAKAEAAYLAANNFNEKIEYLKRVVLSRGDERGKTAATEHDPDLREKGL